MSCPVCQSTNTSPKFLIERFQPPFVMAECHSCHSLFQDPMPQDAGKFYGADYYLGKAEFSYTDERQYYRYAAYVHRARLNTILRHLPPPLHGGKLLDVGCGFGGFVLSGSKYFQAYGLDISPYAIQQGRLWLKQQQASLATALYQGSLTELPQEAPFQPNSFSVITLIEVAEHLAEPRLTFAKAYELLKPGGLLLIQTANFAGWQAIWAGAQYHYFLPGHLVCFTAGGLKQLLQKCGFSLFKEFIPVDFSCRAKLLKARGQFKKASDYLRWFKISWYHFKGKFSWRGRPLVSSYVLYAFK